MKNAIIILGGMGPQASLKLHELIIKGSEGRHEGTPTSYPAVLHVSIPVPDFTNSNEAYDEALELIKNICGTLPMEQASTVGIACNTAHLMVDQLALKPDTFVSMIDSVVTQVSRNEARKVGLLASPHTIKTGLYHDALKRHGVDSITPDKDQVQQINHIIHAVIKGTNSDIDRKNLTNIAENLKSRGADTILLGCTELPLVGITDLSIPVIDSLSALAEAMLNNHYSRSV